MPSSPISLCSSCPPHPSNGHCRVYPSSLLTDVEWVVLEPSLPPPANTEGRGDRPEKHCRRMILDASLCLVRGGIAWRQLPTEFPPPTRCTGRREDGTTARKRTVANAASPSTSTGCGSRWSSPPHRSRTAMARPVTGASA